MTIIFHETSIRLAQHIASSGILLANDPHLRCANFYKTPFSTSESTNSGISLMFEWSGPVAYRCESGTALEGEALFHISANSCGSYDSENYWCSRIFSSSGDSLKLIGLSFREPHEQKLSFWDRMHVYKITKLSSVHKVILVK